MVGKIQKRLIAAALALVCAAPMSAQDNKEQTDSLVRLMKGTSVELIEKNGRSYRKAIDATFLHNGTYLICDTALWNVDTKVINCWGHVQMIQDETVLTSEKLDYFIDDDLAQFRGEVVQLRNKDDNILRTRYLDYNTKDSTAIFRNGAAMRDKDGQVIESRNGDYNSASKIFNFKDKVNMFTDSVFVRTTQLVYDGASGKAQFPVYIDFWKDENMLSARTGWYDHDNEIFFFHGDVHGLSENQETWCDSMYFYRVPQDVLMLGHAQIQDTSRHVSGLANYIFYQDSLARVTMRRDAAVALRTDQDGKIDTLYFGADTLVYETVRMCDIPEGEINASRTRLEDISADAVTAYRRKAAEEAARKAAEAAENDPNRQPQVQKKDKAPEASADEGEAPAAPSDSLATLSQPRDSLSTQLDSLSALSDSLSTQLDSLAAPAASLSTQLDSLSAPADSLSTQLDSLAALPPKDTTKVGFLKAVSRVRMFRKDMQVRCDSLRYCDLDSIARLYKSPVIWNDGNRQYTADSLSVLIRGGGVDRASLMSNAFIITQESDDYFDQIKGAEVMAFFDSTSALRRFDALGGALALFFLQEKDTIATVNKVETKMMSALMKDGDLDKVYYFDAPKNDAYPIPQMPKTDFRMKGFNWQPENRPSCPEDITPLKVKPTEREAYESRPKAEFPQTDIYFPGYMAGVYKFLEEQKARRREAANRHPEEVPDSLAVPLDSLRSPADSLAAPVDSLTLSQPDSAAVSTSDSLSRAGADTLAVAASDSTLKAPPALSKAELRARERAERKERRATARALRIAERDARWARLDSLDAAKAAAKEQKALEKKREQTRKQYIAQLKQEAKDSAQRQKYIDRYLKKKAKDESEQEHQAPRELPQGTQERGDLPPADRSGEQTSGSDPVLRTDGPVDGGDILRRGGVPGPEGGSGI